MNPSAPRDRYMRHRNQRSRNLLNGPVRFAMDQQTKNATPAVKMRTGSQTASTIVENEKRARVHEPKYSGGNESNKPANLGTVTAGMAKTMPHKINKDSNADHTVLRKIYPALWLRPATCARSRKVSTKASFPANCATRTSASSLAGTHPDQVAYRSPPDSW